MSELISTKTLTINADECFIIYYALQRHFFVEVKNSPGKVYDTSGCRFDEILDILCRVKALDNAFNEEE